MKYKATAFAIVALFCIGTAPAGSQMPAAAAKKKCKIVIKVVHGHKRKVKVCPKPAPTVKNVSLTLDSGRSASAAVTVATGGEITTRTASGAKLTLTIPKDALPYDATVKVTPVSKIAGVTGKLIAGVQFQPEGLVLAKPATLTIVTPKAVRLATAMDWVGSGKFAERYPVTKSGSQLRFSVLHFSGLGGYDGPISSLPGLREGQLALYKNQVLPKVQAALNSDSAFSEAISLYLSWSRTFDLIDDPSFMASERAHLKKLIKQAFINQINRAYDSCKTKHDVGKELRNLLAYARQAQGGAALLLENAQAAKEIEDLANEDAKKCGSFQLDFETVITGNAAVADGGGSNFTSHVQVLSLHIQAVGSSTDQIVPPPAMQPLAYLTWEWQSFPDVPGDAPCKRLVANGIRLIDPFSVERLDLSPDDSSVSMDVSVGSVAEKVIWQPCGTDGGETSAYNATFFNLHKSELNGAGFERFRIAGWSVLHGSVYARKTYQQTTSFSVSDVTYTPTETTTFDLKHTPE